MNNFTDYLLGRNVPVGGLPNTFTGVVQAELYDKDGSKHLIHAGNVSNGNMKIILPDYEQINDVLCTQYFTPHGIDDPGIGRRYNSFSALTISDDKKKYDQVMCIVSSGEGLEDRISFHYSNKEARIIERTRADTIMDGKTYTRIWDIDCEFKFGWNLIWEHLMHTVADQSDCVTRQRKTDLENVPQNIRWKCLNH